MRAAGAQWQRRACGAHAIGYDGVHLTGFNKNRFTRLDDLRRLSFQFESELTFKDVAHKRSGVPVPSFASADRNTYFSKHRLVPWNRRVLLKHDLAL
jgi:hypothetical protein